MLVACTSLSVVIRASGVQGGQQAVESNGALPHWALNPVCGSVCKSTCPLFRRNLRFEALTSSRDVAAHAGPLFDAPRIALRTAVAAMLQEGLQGKQIRSRGPSRSIFVGPPSSGQRRRLQLQPVQKRQQEAGPCRSNAASWPAVHATTRAPASLVATTSRLMGPLYQPCLRRCRLPLRL